MSSIVDGYSEPVRSSVALGFAFLPCSHTLEAWRRSRCPSSGSLTVSLTLLRRDSAFMQSISDQAGVILTFIIEDYYCHKVRLQIEHVISLHFSYDMLLVQLTE
ncbi:Hypothetical_protein [Hexamita inflata]|uniref:Hypothetical_protein n=1 Tax=Hexamita inflata TaxID=28002 RepID=A0AA86QQ15_9EUKA|nr:Hypothetical protein HINF_LOCUS50120 [Hexamita inflata]